MTILQHPFAGTIIRAVLVCYSVWGSAVVVDLATCEVKRPGKCGEQRAELRSAATAIPTTLLAWLADSPLSGKPAPSKPASTRKPSAPRTARKPSASTSRGTGAS
jgi:hypothetical protein